MTYNVYVIKLDKEVLKFKERIPPVYSERSEW